MSKKKKKKESKEKGKKKEIFPPHTADPRDHVKKQFAQHQPFNSANHCHN